MSALMRRLLGHVCMDEMDDDLSGGGGGGDGGSDTTSEPAGDQTSGSGSGESDSGSEQNIDPDRPKTMLEAISRELDKEPKEGEPNGVQGKQDAQQHPGKTQPNAAGKTPDGKPAANVEDEPMPEGLSPRAQERFHKLSNRAKELAQSNNELQQQISKSAGMASLGGTFANFIRDTGTNGEQLNIVGQYLSAANKGDYETEAKILIGRLREIQIETGKDFDISVAADPLAEYPDLQQEVDQYRITREHALEVANARRIRAGQQQQQQRDTEQSQQQQRVQEENARWIQHKDAAITVLQQWEKGLQTDPHYAAIAPMIVSNKELVLDIVQNFPPNTWQQRLNMLYNQLKTAYVAAGGPASRTSGQTLRPLSGSNGRPQGARPKPRSMREAMFPD